jgi:acylphosphatase
LTLIKNKVEETALTCNITGLVNYCSSGEIKISVNEGDEILLKAESSSNAPFAIIKSSMLFEGQ